MSSPTKSIGCDVTKAPSPPMNFPVSGFPIIPDGQRWEEENYELFKPGYYYPVNIGDVLVSKYQIVGKLGWGSTSTVWLARDLEAHQYVTLKIYAQNEEIVNEFGIYQYLERIASKSTYPGRQNVRTAIGTFVIPRPGGDHECLVQPATWESWRDLLYRIPSGVFNEELLKLSLKQLLLALDFLHSECKIIHTDSKGDNMLHSIFDQTLLTDFAAAEMEGPSPRKIVDGVPIYASRRFGFPKALGPVVLGDFRSAVKGEEKRNHNAGPDIYRAPEVIIKADWSYPVDIWNVGVLIWDLFEGKHLFCNLNEENGVLDYSTGTHLAEIIGALGPPPLDLLERGIRSDEWFHKDGTWKAEIEIPEDASLDKLEVRYVEGEHKTQFMHFVRCMLQWRPEDRKTAKELLQHPWLNL
ncbi:Protein kinase-like (PK-like) [Glarea lozoyensis ATCC 20868]|uniref:non-specific serine/threonine protein kinase n=1 Tax=Glarea lozoyensis (strain ATCC 20868 / MF5171) TaxID=1116229 RepID=S3DRY4_GLAL2|nr:Protein kinase-like (PK-like) [Glarea lozoyensis ATCC 20868]EPE29213.1 Protein kinase-like (PK-like) [Glarea lozoyensis ATCC 20868]